MDKIIKYSDNWSQPQLFSLIVTVLICFILSLVVYIKIKREARADKAPKAFLLIVEGYVTYVEGSFLESTEGKIPKARIYIFGLASFLLVGNLIGMIGLEPIATSYSVTLALGLVTWLGIYVTGLLYQKFRFFKRFLNPLELIGQFAPLISISFRMFGNIIGGGTIVLMIYLLAGICWDLIPGTTQSMFFFASLITPFLHMYFDIFGAFIQCLVFTMLTTLYWSTQAQTSAKKNRKNKKSTNLEKVQVAQTSANVY